MVAMRRDEPHWLLSDHDANVYGAALQKAIRHIPIRTAQKTIDFTMLVIAVGQFEIPRIYMSMQLAKMRAQAARGMRPAAPHFQFNNGTSSQPPPSPSGTPPRGTDPLSSSPQSGGMGAAPSAAPNGGRAPNGGAPLDMTYEPEADEPRFGP